MNMRKQGIKYLLRIIFKRDFKLMFIFSIFLKSLKDSMIQYSVEVVDYFNYLK